MHGRVRHGDCRARGGDLDQLKPFIQFRVGARRCRWLAPAARTCRINPRVLRCGASNCPHGPRRRSDYRATTLLTTYRIHARRPASSLIEGRLRRRSGLAKQGCKSWAQNVPREREWLFDIGEMGIAENGWARSRNLSRPHPEERACR